MPESLESKLNRILNEYSNTKVFPATQQALKESAQETAELMRRSSPVGSSSNRFIDNWIIAPYKNVVFVGNAKETKGRIPLINIINHRTGLVGNVWAANQKSTQQKLISNLKNKLK